jgi:hypothetical protein
MSWNRSDGGWWLTDHPLEVHVDAATGAIDRLHLRSDRTGSGEADRLRMNWAASTGNGWHPISHGWGLGMIGGRPFSGRDDAPVRWQRPTSVVTDGEVLAAVYEGGGWRVEVTRRPCGDALVERVDIRNVLDRPRDVGSLWFYTPFNVDVVGGAADLRLRCHAHVWAGGRETWIKAVRWSGEGPHVGLAANTGDFAGYGLDGITEYAGSPVRGDISLVARDVLQTDGGPGSSLLTVAAGETLRFGWTVFPFADDEDFTTRAAASLGREPLRADRYVLIAGESTAIRGAARDESPVVIAGPAAARIDGGAGGFTVTMPEPGVARIAVGDPARPATSVTVVAVPDLEELVGARTRFIRERQQVLDPGSPRFGALLPYDNRFDAMMVDPPRHDYNDGRERVGMGVLLAQRRQTHPDDGITAATDRYAGFVADRLQSPAGVVYDSSDDRTTERLYNYPWVCRFWLEMYVATGDDRYADRLLNTVRAFYRAGGARFYAIGMPILRGHRVLSERGRHAEAAELLDLHRANADFIRARGVDYPSHEVPFEQTIVGPAAIVLLELHLATGDPALRREAAEHLRLLELFGGPQPDGRLHDVPIRHWDGYWFGARPRWGDVMPHHWSAVTAWAWALRGLADRDETWSRRARRLSTATLHTFTADGRASAAFVYPLIVNGQHEHSFDPLANDQDWALVTALDIQNLA